MDVEIPASRRALGDQRPARAAGAAGARAAHLRGCDSQPVHPGLSREAGRAARPLHVDLVRGHSNRRISPVLCRVLRCKTLRDARPRHRDGAERLRGLAQRQAAVVAGLRSCRPAARPAALQQLPSRQRRHRSLPAARKSVWQSREVGRRQHRYCRRHLCARVDPSAGGQGCRRFSADYAHLSRPARRGGDSAPDRRDQGARRAVAPGSQSIARVPDFAAMITVTPRPRRNYLNVAYNPASWLLTLDHKRIAILYLLAITFFFVIGGIAASLMRLELMTPAGDLVESEDYNKLFTIHGITMIFFFLIPAIPAVLGNFLIPLMLGARDLASPRLNLLSWYLFMCGGLLTLWSIFAGGVDTGWTFYTPYSSTYSNTYVMTTAVGVFITGFSSILTGLNFIVTTHKMRAPGLTWFRLPLFVWSHYAASLIMVLGTPVVAIAILLVGLERMFGVGIFDPSMGGDPLLFQHLFWFYSHPAVYIMVLPAFGVISELVATFSQ